MRTLAIVAVALLVFCGAALAQGATWESVLGEAGFDNLEALSSKETGVDAREVLEWALSGDAKWDAERLKRLPGKLWAHVKPALFELIAALAVPVLASVALRSLLGSYEASGTMGLLCRLSCAALLMARFVSDSRLAGDMLTGVAKLIDTATPVLASIMAMAGSMDASAVLSPASTLCVGAIHNVLLEVALPLCGVAAIVATAADLSDRFQLGRLFALFRQGIVAGVRLMIAAFAGLMAVEGLLAAGQDSATSRVIQRAIRRVLPIVGGQLSDSTSALIAGARAVRNAVGVTGLTVVLGACAQPVLKLMASMLSLRLAAAIFEPVADPGIVRTIENFSELSRMLIAICACCAVLYVLLVGACLGMASFGAG